jgi:hypothetical protein
VFGRLAFTKNPVTNTFHENTLSFCRVLAGTTKLTGAFQKVLVAKALEIII